MLQPELQVETELRQPDAQRFRPIDFLLQRLAAGEAVEAMSAELVEFGARFEDIELKRTGAENPRWQLSAEIIEKRDASRKRLGWRGLTPAGIKDAILPKMPSLATAQPATINAVATRKNRLGELFVELHLTDEDSKRLKQERLAFWEHLAKFGNFGISGMPWLQRNPELRLAYIDGGTNLRRARLQSACIEKIVENYLDLEFSLLPAYEPDAAALALVPSAFQPSEAKH
jgi:hypothetical protein